MKKREWDGQEIHVSDFTLYEDKTLRLKGYYMKNSSILAANKLLKH